MERFTRLQEFTHDSNCLSFISHWSQHPGGSAQVTRPHETTFSLFTDFVLWNDQAWSSYIPDLVIQFHTILIKTHRSCERCCIPLHSGGVFFKTWIPWYMNHLRSIWFALALLWHFVTAMAVFSREVPGTEVAITEMQKRQKRGTKCTGSWRWLGPIAPCLRWTGHRQKQHWQLALTPHGIDGVKAFAYRKNWPFKTMTSHCMGLVLGFGPLG